MASSSVLVAFMVLTMVVWVISEDADQSMLGKIKSSFAYAGKVLGLDRAAEVAKLVSDAFAHKSRKGDTGDQHFSGNTIFSGFLRILGFDQKRIGAIAVNAIIFIAQLISTAFANQKVTADQTIPGTGSPMDWMMGTTDTKRYMRHVRDEQLPDRIIEFLKEGPHGDRTACLQLLVCKSAPLVWGMQKAIKRKPKDIKQGKSILSEYLPSRQEITGHGDDCELKYPNCDLSLT